jgi:hypothetical protein
MFETSNAIQTQGTAHMHTQSDLSHLQTYTLADVISAFDASDRCATREFFYYNTDARFCDMSRSLADAVMAGREVALFDHDGMTIAHLGGGEYMVNERSTGAGDSVLFTSDSHQESCLDAADAWRA